MQLECELRGPEKTTSYVNTNVLLALMIHPRFGEQMSCSEHSFHSSFKMRLDCWYRPVFPLRFVLLPGATRLEGDVGHVCLGARSPIFPKAVTDEGIITLHENVVES